MESDLEKWTACDTSTLYIQYLDRRQLGLGLGLRLWLGLNPSFFPAKSIRLAIVFAQTATGYPERTQANTGLALQPRKGVDVVYGRAHRSFALSWTLLNVWYVARLSLSRLPSLHLVCCVSTALKRISAQFIYCAFNINHERYPVPRYRSPRQMIVDVCKKSTNISRPPKNCTDTPFLSVGVIQGTDSVIHVGGNVLFANNSAFARGGEIYCGLGWTT